ncbi:MAG: flagellar export chaperone FliS [Rubrivivax sp.]
MHPHLKSSARAYQQVHVETGTASADPHKLIEMLLQGALESMTRARGALARSDQATKIEEVRRAVRIVEEGLRSSLDHASGGQIAQDLDRLYSYITWRLAMANLRNDQAMLTECFNLLSSVYEAWCAIRGSVGSGRLQ